MEREEYHEEQATYLRGNILVVPGIGAAANCDHRHLQQRDHSNNESFHSIYDECLHCIPPEKPDAVYRHQVCGYQKKIALC